MSSSRRSLRGVGVDARTCRYFNTVGSKEGWVPSNFVSSRSNRKKGAIPVQQKPEDFMDEEDVADAEEARELQTTDSFAGLGSTADDISRHDSFMDILKTSGETMGVKLLKKMGWREGQGVGLKVKRKARLDEGRDPRTEASQELHLFGPENSSMIAFVRKNDRQGLGFEGEGRLSESNHVQERSSAGGTEIEDRDVLFGTLETSKVKTKKEMLERKGGFGVGVLNDEGSDDEDPYRIGPQISYNRAIGGEKKKKKKPEASKSSANPLINSKPVFISKKLGVAKTNSNLLRCYDGRLPLNDFVLSSDPDPFLSNLSQEGMFPPPEIPQDWKSSKKAIDATAPATTQPDYQSPAALAAASKLSPKSRAALLGEALLPGKSVFDYITPNARTRIASAANNPNLPPALSEANAHLPSSHPKTFHNLIPSLAKETALTALGRGTSGWMPYAEDPAKRARYRLFLEIQAALRPTGTLPDRAPGASNDDWVKEMNEFAHAAQIFKPMTGIMASRFTSSSSAPKLASDNIIPKGTAEWSGESQLPTQPTGKVKTPAEEAAAVGMYGPLTRSMENIYPTRLLCKRFNIKPPAHVLADPGDAPSDFGGGPAQGAGAAPQTHSTALPQKRLELVGKRDMDELRMSGRGQGILASSAEVKEEDAAGGGGGSGGDGAGEEGKAGREEAIVVDPERNEALEKERPGEALFRAIFGSDSEDDI